jgi:hypothetical protein
MNIIDELAYMQWLKAECGYIAPRPLGDGRYICVMPLLFTAAIIVGRIGEISYDNRWCYHSIDAASLAMEAWDGSGEPEGWHRHPSTGRRRVDGDVSREYIAP